MKNAVLSRREREKNQHRQEVLDTALKLFSEKGFYNVSMQEIAEKSEFGIGTLYNYFESKEQLFTELMKAGIEKFQDFLVPILDSNEREDKKISEFIRSHIDLIESNIELIRLYISQYGATFVKPVYQFPSMDLEALITKKL
jgi:AcrR family transcriptional regulator